MYGLKPVPFKLIDYPRRLFKTALRLASSILAQCAFNQDILVRFYQPWPWPGWSAFLLNRLRPTLGAMADISW